MISQAKERCIGLSTLECTKFIVSQNPQISHLYLRPYIYTPDQPYITEPFPVGREEFLFGQPLTRFAEHLALGDNVALDSQVVASLKVQNLAMMDFAPVKSDQAQARIKERFSQLIVPKFGGGFLLETGRSYHFLGENILDNKGWLDFLGYCLLTSIEHELIADARYIGYSIIRRSTGLRVTTAGTKTFQPRCVAII